VSSYLEILINFKKDNYKINGKNCLEILVTDLLFFLLYKKKTKKMINLLLDRINDISLTLITCRKNRSFERKRITPSTKWNINGNKCQYNKKKIKNIKFP
jgi:hypothetical protein